MFTTQRPLFLAIHIVNKRLLELRAGGWYMRGSQRDIAVQTLEHALQYLLNQS
jgi:hypothetical protein